MAKKTATLPLADAVVPLRRFTSSDVFEDLPTCQGYLLTLATVEAFGLPPGHLGKLEVVLENNGADGAAYFYPRTGPTRVYARAKSLGTWGAWTRSEDTGRRDIASEWLNTEFYELSPTLGRAWTQRVGDMVRVYLRVKAKSAVPLSTPLLRNIPPGFENTNYSDLALLSLSGTLVVMGSQNSSVRVANQVGVVPAGAPISVVLEWPTTNAFPTPDKYPGTPV